MEKEVPVNRYVRLQDGRVGITKFFGYIHGKRKRFVGIELIDGGGYLLFRVFRFPLWKNLKLWPTHNRET